jgi:F-type H+-transporting ATPase subunit c
METAETTQAIIQNAPNIALITKIICATLVVSTGTFASAFSQGRIAQAACESIAKGNEAAAKSIRSVFFYGIVFVETCALYCLILALLLLLFL